METKKKGRGKSKYIGYAAFFCIAAVLGMTGLICGRRLYINRENLLMAYERQALEDAGVKPSAEDAQRMAQGRVPESLLADAIHFNAKGYEALGRKIYERMQQLGYFDEIEEAVTQYGSLF